MVTYSLSRKYVNPFEFLGFLHELVSKCDCLPVISSTFPTNMSRYNVLKLILLNVILLKISMKCQKFCEKK